jgi:hypothetical protein
VDVVTLTKVQITGQMAVNFDGEEQGFQLWRARPLELRADGTPVRAAVRLSTIEIATRDRGRRGHTAVIAHRPASLDWFGWSQFKSVSHNPSRQLEALLDASSAAPFSPETALWAALSAMKTDPFGNEDQLFARFRQLEKTDSLPDPSEYYDESDRASVRGSKANRATRDPELAFGICADFEGCRGLLRVSEVVQETLEAAKAGKGTMHNGTPMPLSTSAASLATELMEAAIIQALAGPGTRDGRSLNKGAVKSGTVAVLAKRFFEDSLRNLHKRTDSEEHVYQQGLPAIERPEPPPGPETRSMTREEIQGRIQRASQALQASAYPITNEIWGTLANLLRSELEQVPRPGRESRFRQSVENACIYCAALATVLDMPHQMIEALQTLRPNYPLFVEAVLGREVGPDL